MSVLLVETCTNGEELNCVLNRIYGDSEADAIVAPPGERSVGEAVGGKRLLMSILRKEETASQDLKSSGETVTENTSHEKNGNMKTVTTNELMGDHRDGEITNGRTMPPGQSAFHCSKCNVVASSKYRLQKHVLRTHGGHTTKSQPKEFQCKNCDKSFYKRQNLAAHKLTHTSTGSYLCHSCGKTFKQSSGLSEHIAEQHCSMPIPTCTAGQASDLTRADSSDPGVSIVGMCEVCGKGFNSSKALKRHTKELHGRDFLKYRFKYCPRMFRKPYLFVHERFHSGERPFTCDLCESTFTCKYRLANHKVRVHQNHTGGDVHKVRQTYKCPSCENTYTTKWAMERHTVVHNGKGAHTCQHCSRQFARKYLCLQHEAICLGDDDHRIHNCPTCGVNFARKRQLKTHMASHEEFRPFQCEQCPLAFKDKANLQHHVKWHQGGRKENVCEVCGKSFSSMHYLLTIHSHIHTGTKPRQCSFCEKSFVHPIMLRQHMDKHHPGQSPPKQKSSQSSERNMTCPNKGTQELRLTEETVDHSSAEDLEPLLSTPLESDCHIQNIDTMDVDAFEELDISENTSESLSDTPPVTAMNTCGDRTIITDISPDVHHNSYTALPRPHHGPQRIPGCKNQTLKYNCSSCACSFSSLRHLVKHKKFHQTSQTVQVKSRPVHMASEPAPTNNCSLSLTIGLHIDNPKRCVADSSGGKPHGCHFCHKHFRQMAERNMHEPRKNNQGVASPERAEV